jgi:hypothetical protein
MKCNSSLKKTLISVSHASFAPFVPYERIMFFLSGHLDRISQQSHKSGPTGCRVRSPYPWYFVKELHYAKHHKDSNWNKEAANRFTDVDTPDGLSEQGCYREYMHIGQAFFRWYRYSISGDNLHNIRLRTQALDSISCE